MRPHDRAIACRYSDRLLIMEGDKPSLWERSRLLRAVSYSTVTSVLISGFVALNWGTDPPIGVLTTGYYRSLANVAGITFWLTFVPVIGILQFVRAPDEQGPESAKKDDQ
jgi:hypothetical protein